jgi:hypothetical protein
VVYEIEVMWRIVELQEHVARKSVMKIDLALAELFKYFWINVFIYFLFIYGLILYLSILLH